MSAGLQLMQAPGQNGGSASNPSAGWPSTRATANTVVSISSIRSATYRVPRGEGTGIRKASAIWQTVHAERRRLAADIAELRDEQWHVPSLCPGWDVHDGHCARRG